MDKIIQKEIMRSNQLTIHFISFPWQLVQYCSSLSGYITKSVRLPQQRTVRDYGIACVTFDDRPIGIDKDACPFNVAEIMAHNVNLSIPLCRQELTGIQILLPS